MALSITDQKQRALALLDKQEPKIADAFRQGINALQDMVVISEVAEKLRQGDTAGAASFLTPNNVGASLSGYLNTLVGTFHAGALLAQDASDIKIFFSTASTTTAQIWERYQSQKIVDITQQTAETINQIIRRGLLNGRNPLDMARDIKGSIGLTATQEATVNAYRTQLENRLSAALQRQLRDRRFDGTLERAIANGKALKPEQVDAMVDRYRQKMLQFRAQTIARTEATTAVSQGNVAFYRQATNSGAVMPGELRKFWSYTHDAKTRTAHRLIPTMNKDGVPIDGNFQSLLGPIAFPGDPTADPANIINCRCTLFYRRIPV